MNEVLPYYPSYPVGQIEVHDKVTYARSQNPSQGSQDSALSLIYSRTLPIIESCQLNYAKPGPWRGEACRPGVKTHVLGLGYLTQHPALIFTIYVLPALCGSVFLFIKWVQAKPLHSALIAIEMKECG